MSKIEIIVSELSGGSTIYIDGVKQTDITKFVLTAEVGQPSTLLIEKIAVVGSVSGRVGSVDETTIPIKKTG